MSGLILDTSIVIEIERGNKEIIKKLNGLKVMHPSPPKISFITYFEFIHGLRKKSLKNKEASMNFIKFFEIVQTTKETAEFLSDLKGKYELSLTDLFIASHVIEGRGILVTRDKDFERITEINKIFL